jgi:hypothetical protein
VDAVANRRFCLALRCVEKAVSTADTAFSPRLDPVKNRSFCASRHFSHTLLAVLGALEPLWLGVKNPSEDAPSQTKVTQTLRIKIRIYASPKALMV